MTVLGLQRAIVPVVVLDDERGAEPLADALTKGGITCAEITFRTAAAPSAIRRIAARPDFLVGAGTVITTDQVDAAVDAGARFIVSPGLDLELVARARELGVTVLPGIATPSELQAAVRAGLSAVKVFPVEQLGGLRFIDALSAPFPDVRFFPSGGIRPDTARSFLDHPAVFAIGASWMVSRADIAGGRFDLIARASRAAVTALALDEADAGVLA
jgi:2-dehydro-3-deoxyphosphogluconate aldolase / (4S)-4-hydroxy-2-oxoglutarate aldolase